MSRLSTRVEEKKSRIAVIRRPQSTTFNASLTKIEVEESFFQKNALKKPKFLHERLVEGKASK